MPANSAKGANYARLLDLVRRAGLWDNKAPVTAKGVLTSSGSEPGALTWEELARKFGKHNPERGATAEAALADQTIHSLLERAAYENDFDDSAHFHDDPERGRVQLPPLILEGDRGSAEWSLSKVENVARGGQGTGSEQDRNSAKIVLAFAHYSLGHFDQCLSILDEARTDIPEGKSGEGGGLSSSGLEPYDLALYIMASALRGLANERRGDMAQALDHYRSTVKAYDSALSLLRGRDDRNDEMHAWGEEAMYRLALLSRKHHDELGSLQAHRAYHFHSRYWPSTYRLAKRGSFLCSYLQLLYICARHHNYRPSRSSGEKGGTEEPTSAGTHRTFASQQAELLPGAAWRSEVLSVQRAYESILRRTTKFPKAGSVNAPMLEFCDLALEGWNLGGRQPDEAEEVVEMLYRATTVTFQSQRILRYLVDLLYSKGSYLEAKEALLLYCQLFARAKETGAGQQERRIKDSRQKANPDEDFHDDGGGFDEPDDGPGGDFDSDEQYIHTLLIGVRLLVKQLDDPDLATTMAERAKQTVDGDEDRFGAKMRSRVERMLGIAVGAQSSKADRETRPELQSRYLSHLTRAVKLDESSFENLYHLAFCQAELRQVGVALATARRACEVRPQSKEAWHLVALLVTAQRDLRLALDVIDSGLAEVPSSTTEPSKVNGQTNGLAPPPVQRHESNISSDSFEDARDGETPDVNGTGDQEKYPLRQGGGGGGMSSLQEQMAGLSTADAGAGSGKSNIAATATRLEFDQNEADELEATVQLRMTRNVVVESVEGAEAALQDQQTLFHFFSQIAPLIKNRAPKKEYRDQPPITAEPTPSDAPTEAPVNSRQPFIKGLGRRNVSGASQAGGPSRRASTASKSIAPAQSVRGITPFDNDASPEEDQAQQKLLRARSDALLQALWLMSAATFRRWGKNTECKAAVQEAETLNGDHPDVWVQFGLYSLAIGDIQNAISSLTKSLSFSQDHIPAVVNLARLFVTSGSAELAEGLLDVLTQTTGWDVPEAWLLLGKVQESTRRHQRARECFLYALQLEETKPVRPLHLSVPRVL